MSYLDELAREVTTRDRPARLSDLVQAVRAIADMASQVERHRKTLASTAAFVANIEARLLLVDALPAEAPLGALIRLRTCTVGQRANLYLGNGPGQPLSKLVPVAV